MKTSNKLYSSLIVAALMLFAALTRLIPHPANFTAVMAIALFGGVQLRKPAIAILIPLTIMFATDLIIGFYSLMPVIYGSIALIALIGVWISHRTSLTNSNGGVKKSYPLYIIGGSLISSVLFFLTTNAGVWYHNPLYTQSISGLILCYEAAIPFFKNQVFGDLFFNAALFGTFALVSKRMPALKLS